MGLNSVFIVACDAPACKCQLSLKAASRSTAIQEARRAGWWNWRNIGWWCPDCLDRHEKSQLRATHCKVCGTELRPDKYARGINRNRVYCSEKCQRAGRKAEQEAAAAPPTRPLQLEPGKVSPDG